MDNLQAAAVHPGMQAAVHTLLQPSCSVIVTVYMCHPLFMCWTSVAFILLQFHAEMGFLDMPE